MSDFREHPEVYKSLDEGDVDEVDEASARAVETATTTVEQNLKTDEKHEDRKSL